MRCSSAEALVIRQHMGGGRPSRGDRLSPLGSSAPPPAQTGQRYNTMHCTLATEAPSDERGTYGDGPASVVAFNASVLVAADGACKCIKQL